ncbi:sterol desaturase family protein [Polluticaenibacter yanchengensis]|uniref:Sterol desaturase family protein n=1 Tax=Polluticaenibacter yanchengensis TaxID=3014562 RepID=A0ABT4UJZ3_9BACT|nr:sterol desaturase family protein [Chitinophagaceae bacterium LY-5]
MNAIIDYFSTLESKPLHRLAFLAFPIFILWLVESIKPLKEMRYRKSKSRHAIINFGFTICHLIIHAALAVFLVMLCDWCQLSGFGIVHWLHFNSAWTIIFGVLAMDFFGGWLVHFVEHKTPLFWRAHIVHHTDTNIDVTSGLRHHPIEAFIRWLFFMIGILITGIPIYVVLIAQTLMSMFTMFTHANINLPYQLDRWLSYIFVSPNMHKVHHHYKQPFTDSNYGTAFSIWDRLLGTYLYLSPNDIVYGLDNYYKMEDDEDVKKLLKSPFKNYTK